MNSGLQPTPERPSALARYALVVMLLAVIQATLYPWTEWRSLGASPFAFLTDPLPRRLQTFDVSINIAAYVPLGLLAVYAAWPRWRGWKVALIAFVLASVLSLLLEATQSYLPSRYPSKVDWWTNTAGGAIGALLGWATAHKVFRDGPIARWLASWFEPEAAAPIILLGLWMVAQIHPQPLLMGTGEILEPLVNSLSANAVATSSWLGYQLSSDQFISIEAIAMSLAAGVIAVLAYEVLRPGALRAALVAGMLGGALAIRTLASTVLLSPTNAFGWLTAGAQAGTLLAIIWVSLLSWIPRRARLVIAVLSLGIEIVLVNFAPENAYYDAAIAQWEQGRWLTFNGVAACIAAIWPFLAIWHIWARLGTRGERVNRA